MSHLEKPPIEHGSKTNKDLMHFVRKEIATCAKENDIRTYYFREKSNPFYLQPGSAMRITYLNSKTETKPVSFTGILMKTKSTTFTMRTIIAGVYVEKVFQLFSPLLVGVDVLYRCEEVREDIYDARENPREYFKVLKNRLNVETPEARLKQFLKENADSRWKVFNIAKYQKIKQQ